ncbi:MAG TPA: M14 family zinc carboxypeptidase, partial [Dyadobacter sp.]|nr:M14 family zinc carboxypeptidase [Dyadobacter sp.]
MKLSVKLFIFFIIALTTIDSSAQSADQAKRLFDAHENFKEATLTQRRFKQKDVLPLIEKRKSNPLYAVESVGQSFEGRNIQMLKLGKGSKKVLLWTQMHGDEPTATMASFDMFNFFEGKNDGFDALRKKIL